MNLIQNKHKIYYLGGTDFLIVYKVRGESPTRWQKTFISANELFESICYYYGVENAFKNYYTNNKSLHLMFMFCKDSNDFISKLKYLEVNSKICNLLANCEVHGFSIDSYKQLNKKVKFDLLHNQKRNLNYIFVSN